MKTKEVARDEEIKEIIKAIDGRGRGSFLKVIHHDQNGKVVLQLNVRDNLVLTHMPNIMPGVSMDPITIARLREGSWAIVSTDEHVQEWLNEVNELSKVQTQEIEEIE